MLSRGYQILYRTVCVCNGSFVGLNDLRVLRPLVFLPITDSHMLFIWKSLNMHLPEHCMFWAACTLGYFGFFRAGEFTVPNLASFSSSIHLTMQDIAVNGASSPSCMRVTIKASKADPIIRGPTGILVWVAIRSVGCRLWSLCCKMVVLYLVCFFLTGFDRSSPLLPTFKD